MRRTPPYIYRQPIARQTGSSKPLFSSTTASGLKRSQGLGDSPIVSSVYNDTQWREQSKHSTPSANVLRSNERAGNFHGSATASGDPVGETHFVERDARGTAATYPNNFKPNDNHTLKDGDTSTDSTRSVQNTSHNTNNQDDSQFLAGKSSDRAHGTLASDQRFAKSEWSGSSNRYREENSFGKDIKRPTYNERHADSSDKHTAEGDRHSGYNDRSFNTQDTDDLTSTVELIKTFKSIAPLVDKSLQELAAWQQKDAKTDTEHFKQQVETLQKVIDKLEDERKTWQTEIKKVVLERDQALAQLKEKDLELEREKATDNEHLSMLQQCKNELALLGNENKKMRDELVHKKALYDKIQEDNTQVKAELADYKTRLSKLMGSRLADNNPDIADLSDRNRPTKLAEKYQELYDNEWTDAFEVFEKHYNKDESKAIKSLKIVLEHVKQTCDELSEDQSKMLIESLTMKKTQGGSVSKDINKQLKDLRRSSAESSVEGVLEQYIKQVEELRESGNTLAHLVLNEGIRPFLRGCVQLCWLMTVQDPPLHFGPDPDSRQPVDTNTYKFYTKTGTCIDYVVWPPLFLYKGGPLLYKGIAQGLTPATDKLPEEDKISARERRRENATSTANRTTRNSSSRNAANPPTHSSRSAEGRSQSGQSKASNERERHQYQTVDDSGQSISSEDKKSEVKSPSTVYTVGNTFTGRFQIPKLEDYQRFLAYARTNRLDSYEAKAALGDQYQVCLNYYYRSAKKQGSTNI